MVGVGESDSSTAGLVGGPGAVTMEEAATEAAPQEGESTDE